MDIKCVLMSDFEKVCRICMKFVKTFLQINSFKIIDMITTCASVQIWENDGLPNQICNECFLQLQNTINFKQLCENSDHAFRQIIEQNKNNLWNNQNDLENLKNEELCSISYPVYVKEESDVENVANQDKDDSKKSQNNNEEMVEIKKEDKSELNRKSTRKKAISQKLEEESDEYENINDENDSNYDSENEKLSTLREQQSLVNDYIKCEKCPRSFKKVGALGFHMKRTHNVEGIKCGRCSVVCYHSLHLRAHEKTHNRCRICYSSFSTRKKLTQHKTIHEKSMQCDTCDEKFQTQQDLQKHMRKIHPKRMLSKEKARTKYNKQDANCEICGKSVRRRNLSLHLLTHTEHAENLKVKLNVNCEVCGKSIRRHHLRTHMLTHRELNNLTCRYCAKVFTTPEALTEHEQVSHKKYLCDHCGKRFRSNQLKKHLITHTEERPFACDKCDKTYRTNWQLKEHVSRVHLNERNFVCTFCSQAFFDKKILAAHVRRHTGEKPFKCSMCEKAFIQQSTLKVHMKTHANFI
ncbi:zinc finger protein 675-like isoform X1 [Chrysoperla carnea]|uniref:zinc finger protein 675-like isoform X1 n=1 Tax=Chrysoperla carnea TaxID=189513 RepID=UPI001D072F3C|nr:zinc finger protein 675-like isoform X1 [Chrysoperla carnea]